MPKHFVTPANRVCYCPQCAPAWRAWGKVMRAMARRIKREQTALAAARRFPAAVNVFYCGPEGGPGQDFLRRLAKATGGQYQPVSLAPAQALPALRRVLSLPVPK